MRRVQTGGAARASGRRPVIIDLRLVGLALLFGAVCMSASAVVHVHHSFDAVPNLAALAPSWRFSGPVGLNSSAAFVLKGLALGGPTNAGACDTADLATASVDLGLDLVPVGSRAHLSFMARAVDAFGTVNFVALINATGGLHDADLSWQLTAGRWVRCVGPSFSEFVC
jgi:hypothetical protein